jgi:hypothetical protein
MPLDPGMSRPPTLQARSHDAARACRACRGARRPRRVARKVAQSGRIRGIFRASVHRWNRGGVRGRHVHRWSSETCHRDHLDPLPQQRGGTASRAPLYILRHFRRASLALQPSYGLKSLHVEDLRCGRRRNGFQGLGGGVAVPLWNAGADGRGDPPGKRAFRPAGLERCAAASAPGCNQALRGPGNATQPCTSQQFGALGAGFHPRRRADPAPITPPGRPGEPAVTDP